MCGRKLQTTKRMAFAINIRSDNESANSIRSLWDMCGALERVPSMQSMQYPPHITFAVYDEIEQNDLFAGFDVVMQNLKKLRFGLSR